MKTNTLGTILLVIGVILGAIAWMLHDSGMTILPESPPKNQNTITQTGTSSGTIQVVNSGVTDFRTPNLEWKSRDITLADGRTLHYVFGEGNPKEVALAPEQIEAYLLCKAPFLDPSYENVEGQCAEGRGYVTPEIENALMNFMQDSLWAELMKDPDFNTIFSSGKIPEINDLISINQATGRKDLNESDLRSISALLSPPEEYYSIGPEHTDLRNNSTMVAREILFTMVNNIIGAYHILALGEVQKN